MFFEDWEELEAEYIEKAGLPVGTISGNYKKISDNPSKWEYLSQDEIFNNESGNERRAFLANKAQLITDTQELPASEKNYKAVGTAYLFKMRNEVFTRDVICKANNKKVVDVDTNHIFKDKNTDANKTLRVRALPFVLPIIEKYGKKGLVTKRKDGIYTELVGKADITTKGGNKKRCAIAVILVTDKKNRQSLKQLSVFVVDNKVIKSLTTDAPRTSRLVRSGFSPCASDSHSPACNKSIPHKSRAVNKSVRFEFENITKVNKYEKMEKAVRALSKVLNVPIGIEKSERKGEGFVFKAQEDLTSKWDKFFDDYTKSVYEALTSYFGLPKMTLVSKSDVLTHKGKVLYSPETGQPIKKTDWDKFVKNLERFMNKGLKDSEKKIILDSVSMGKVLDRMLEYNSLEAVKQMHMSDLAYNEKSFDWISESVKNMKNTFGESFSRQEQARIEVMQQSAGLKITNIDSKMRSDIQTILVDGVKNKKSKAQVSQMLFDKMTGDNRDFKRLIDTEIQNNCNNAFVREEVYKTPKGEKSYFQRFEVIDGNTCPFCRKMNGKIAVWSDKPLTSQKADDGIADFVIWEGKEWSGEKDDVCIGAFHPWCRGAWIRYYPDK